MLTYKPILVTSVETLLGAGAQLKCLEPLLIHLIPSHLHTPLSANPKQIRSAALLHTSADVCRTRNDDARTANLKDDNAATLKSPSHCNLDLLF
jgi:hypothetical protein